MAGERFRGQAVVVTGAARSIGLAIAEAFRARALRWRSPTSMTPSCRGRQRGCAPNTA